MLYNALLDECSAILLLYNDKLSSSAGVPEGATLLALVPIEAVLGPLSVGHMPATGEELAHSRSCWLGSS